MKLSSPRGQPAGCRGRAAKAAAGLVNHPQLFAKLPVGLQADETALKNAAPADLDAQANKLRTPG